MFSINNQGRRLKMVIEEYITTRPHHGRRGSPRIPSNTKLFVIKYETGGYFTYSYLRREDAELSIENSKLHRTDNEYYREWNVVAHPEDTMHITSLTTLISDLRT